MRGRGRRERSAVLFDLGETSEAGQQYADVVLDRPVDQILSYRIPGTLLGKVTPGQRVRVPLGRGNQPAVAYCVSVHDQAPEGLESSRLKDVIEPIDPIPLIDQPMLELTRWLARYYLCSWGQALDAVVPAGVKKSAGTALRTFLTVPEDIRMASELPSVPPKQAEALRVLMGAIEPLTLNDVCRLAHCGSGPVLSLRQAGLIHTVKQRIDRGVLGDLHDTEPPTQLVQRPELSFEQSNALAIMAPALNAEAAAFQVFLLHGVTGSGKTEVYLSAIEQVVAHNREAIVLVPEISLTPQTIRRFRRRFDRVAVLHSHLSDTQRHRHWQAIAAGEIQVVVGARSAVFAPARRLGLIVIDEEHEGTFKQESVPRYHARDVAVKRAQQLGVPVILGSATPSLESWRNAEAGRYTRIGLESRVGGRPMPKVELIDLRNEKPVPGQPLAGLSGPLVRAMEKALAEKGQVMLLLNRRGFHTFIICPGCGNTLKCNACDVALTYHKARHQAVCHTSDSEFHPPDVCGDCGNSKLHYGGIGTERLEREVKSAFPDRIIRRMDSDTMRSPGSHEKVLEAFKAGQVEILLGTQMIAKGLDFPDVTLVGVINADTSLHLPDFRASERTFQLVAQVAGRTGRGHRPGRVLVQTFSPDDPAIRHAAHHDYQSFVEEELPRRRECSLPPYGRVARLIVKGPEPAAARAFLESLAQAIREEAPVEVRLLGPAEAPIAKIRNLHRFHLQIRASSPAPLHSAIRSILPRFSIPADLDLAIDIDPVSVL